ncbi:oligosaccharide flippase family protein [Idiomarina seosinensis]|uniref:lipopolysaccharide biosynthesis protein n=1 Tax=Idiomarina seosinensis TaxID=281739 RepID=UPI00384A48A8
MTPRKIAAFAIGPFGGALFGLVTLPVITWFFSQEDVGRLSMLQVVMGFSILLFSLGLDQSYVREFHEVDDRPKLLKHATYPGIVLLSLSVVALMVFGVSLSQLVFGVESFTLNLLIILALLSSFLSRFLSLILRMQERGLAYSMSQLLPKLLLLCTIGAYLFLDADKTLVNLIAAYTAATFFVCLVYGWNTRREWFPSISTKLEVAQFRNMFAFGLPLIVGGLAFWGLTAVDKIFLRALTNFDELAVYSVAVSFAAAATILKSVFSTVWAPIVYKWASQGEGIEKVEKVTNYVLAIVVLVFCLTGLFSWVITYFLPSNYSGVQWIVISCIGYPLLYLLSETTVVGIGITRKSSYSMFAATLAFIVNLIGNWMLIPEYGAKGAAASTCFSFWVFFILRTEFSIFLWQPLPRRRLYLMSALCVAMAIVSTLFGDNWSQTVLMLWGIVLLGAYVVFATEVSSTFHYLRSKLQRV